MKRARPFLLLTALITAFSVTCTDEPQLTEPPDEIVPSMARRSRQLPPDDHDITLLIQALYPPPGLLEAAMNRWANIYQAVGRGSIPAAQEQARLMITDALILLEDEQLRDPPGTVPELFSGTTAEGVRLLADELISYTDQEFQESLDQVTDWIDLSDDGFLETENGWAKFSWTGSGSSRKILASIYLQNLEKCDPEDEKTAFACWDFDQFGGEDFERKVEFCVADNPELTDSEYNVKLRVRKRDEVTGDTEDLPYENSTLDCHCFPNNEDPPPDCLMTTAAQETAPTLLTSIGSAVADLLLPDPLGAFFREDRRPPRGIGGTTSRFSDFWGAVPLEEGEDYTEIPEEAGPADTWEITEPSSDETLCNSASYVCPSETVDEVFVTALATTETGQVDPPFAKVYFYYVPSGQVEPVTLIGSTDGFSDPDGMSWEWTVPLNFDGPYALDVGPIDVFAVGLDTLTAPGSVYRTDVNSHIEVVGGTTVTIESVDAVPGGTPVDPDAVTGQIEVTVAIDPGGNDLSEVSLFLDDEEVVSQSLEGNPDTPFEVTFQINTAEYETPETFGNQIEGRFPNALYALSAEVGLVGAEEPSVTTSMNLTFSNPDTFIGEVTPDASALGPGNLYWKSPYLVDVSPVVYSGQTVNSITVAYLTSLATGPDSVVVGTLTDASEPFSVTFGYGPGAILDGYQTPSAEIGAEQIAVISGSYEGGAPFNPGPLPVPLQSNITTDNVAPPYMVDWYLTDQVYDGWPTCCAANWVNPDYALEDAFPEDDFEDNVDGVGGVVRTFHMGDAALDDEEIAALDAVDTPGEAGLEISLLNTAYGLLAVLRDALGNMTIIPLVGDEEGSNTLDRTVGYDDTPPVDTSDPDDSHPNMFVYNAGTTAPAFQSLVLSATEDRSGFSTTPFRAFITQYEADDVTYVVDADHTQDTFQGPVNLAGLTLPACSGDPAWDAPCYPNQTSSDGVWNVNGNIINQAGGEAATIHDYWVAIDQAVPEVGNLALPAAVVIGDAATFSAPVHDNLHLGCTAFAFDIGGTRPYIPLGEDICNADTDMFDLAFPVDDVAVLTVDPAVTGFERATGGTPDDLVANIIGVRAAHTDLAGNISTPAANNFLAGTVESGDSYGPGGQDAGILGFTVDIGGDVLICNGDPSADPCNPGLDELGEFEVEVVVEGPSGTFPNPFASGLLYVWLVVDGGDATFYSADDIFYLLTTLNAANAAITDEGLGGSRYYTWTFDITSADVAQFADGTDLWVTVGGFKFSEGVVLIPDQQADAITVIARSN